MAVSSSSDFRSAATQIITDARSLLGIQADEEPLQAHEQDRGLRFLTRMLKAWEADGIGSWVLTEGSLTLVDSDGDYVFGSGGSFTTVPFEITQVRVAYNSGNSIEMFRLSREEYYRLPKRTSEGFPTQWFYDRQRDNGTLYVWPEPDDGLYAITFTYRRRIMDMDAGADDFDLPPEWEKAIIENLAYDLIGVYGVSGSDAAKKVARDAAISFAIVKNWDVSEGGGSVSILPDR